MARAGQGEISGGQLLVECLKHHGVTKAFGVPGESYLAILDGLYQSGIEYVICRQEGGAAMMAEAYGKLTGKVGVCMVTRGPGATNASAGVHVAFQDSTPMILLVGQIGRDMVDREAFQEVDYTKMYAPLAKWVAEIRSADRIVEYMNRAFHTALSGRPGPVVLALPEDMLSTAASVAAQQSLAALAKTPVAAPMAHGATHSQLQQLAGMLAKAEKPLVLLGGGGWTAAASSDIADFASSNGLPVAASFRAQSLVDNRHPNYVGHVGIGIDPALATAVRESDVLLVLGARLGEMTTGGYQLLQIPKTMQQLIHIHPDPNEINRTYAADLGISATMPAIAASLAALPALRPQAGSSRLADLRASYQQFSQVRPNPGPLQMADLVHFLREQLPDDTIVCNGAGNYTIWVHRFWQYRQFASGLAPTSGSMGYGVPAAIAAKIAAPERTVIAFAGDGCFQMTGQEIGTAVQAKAGVIILVVNNGMYGTIRMHQERHYPGRVSGTDLVNPDFAALARAYGAWGAQVGDNAAFAAAFATARDMAAQGVPSVIEIQIDPEALTPAQGLTALRNQSLAAAGQG